MASLNLLAAVIHPLTARWIVQSLVIGQALTRFSLGPETANIEPVLRRSKRLQLPPERERVQYAVIL